MYYKAHPLTTFPHKPSWERGTLKLARWQAAQLNRPMTMPFLRLAHLTLSLRKWNWKEIETLVEETSSEASVIFLSMKLQMFAPIKWCFHESSHQRRRQKIVIGKSDLSSHDFQQSSRSHLFASNWQKQEEPWSSLSIKWATVPTRD